MHPFNGTLFCIVSALLVFPALRAAGAPREAYLELALAAYQAEVEACPAVVREWCKTYKPTPKTGYTPPDAPVWLARLAASLYDLTGEEAYASEAAKWLVGHQRFKKFFPQSQREGRPEYEAGLPTLTDFFQVPYFCQAYLDIKDSLSLDAEQRAQIEQSIAESADFLFHHPEWGPMNRAMLRAEGLLLTAQAMPTHPHAATWKKLATILASDSWGHWSEEDSEIYHPVWVNSLIRYADLVEDKSLYSLHTVRYYFDFFLHLLSPVGMVPEYGDARWNENWAEYVACFERGASEYERPDLKWAADLVFRAMAEHSGRPIDARVGIALTDAYRWADDSIQAAPPPARSEEVLEDLIGKKIVFRNGWDADATYLMLNYRDEGPFARVPRDYLRHTIPVEEEKAHHGHADENAICLLMSGGSVLLHEAGYRSAIPSGPYGAFRADYFHNRLVARRHKRAGNQPLFDFLGNSGGYCPVSTEKIEFLRSADVDVSRTRLTDTRTGYQADRVIVYVKPDDAFVIVDIIKILETGYYTFATLWHADAILTQDPCRFVIAVDAIGDYRPSPHRALKVLFLQRGTRETGTFPITRRDREATAVYQTISSHYYAGQTETFVTVLTPLDRDAAHRSAREEQIELLSVDGRREGVGLRWNRAGATQYVCVKTDLMKDVLTDNARPRYTFDSGKVKYGPFTTDASFLYARQVADHVYYVATHMVKVLYNDQVIFTARPNTFALQPDDLSTGYGMSKWRLWEDTVTLD